MRNILILGTIHPAGIERLSAAGHAITRRADNPADLLQQLRDVDAIIVRTTPIDRRVLDAAPRLSLVARHGVGYDAVDVAALSERRIPLALVGDVNSGAVAEHTLALMLALAKRIARYDRAVRAGAFAVRDDFAAIELAGRRALLIGFGRIGRRVAKLCRAFDMEVAVLDPFVAPADIAAAGCEPAAELHAALAGADFVSVHAPRLPGAPPIIDRAALQAMRPGSFLVNVARGGMVDEAALLAALVAGHIAGAGLDVFASEPLPAGDPLAAREDVVLSPHSAAFTAECGRRMSEACADNVIDWFAGALDPALVVNREVLAAAGGARAAGASDPHCNRSSERSP